MENTSKDSKRYLSFDLIRSIGIIGMVFLHAAVFHYGEINSIDMDNLNPALMIFYVLIMWGGLFGLVSGAVNTISTINRIEKEPKNNSQIFKYTIKNLCLTGLMFNILHFIYYLIFGPTNYDLESGTFNHSYGFIPGSIKTKSWYSIQLDRWFEQSSLAMIGWILIFLGIILYFLFRNRGSLKKQRNQWILYIIGAILVAFSFLHIYIFEDVVENIESGNYILAWLLALIGYEPFPFLPYLGYGFIGAGYAISLSQNKKKSIRKYFYLGMSWFLLFIICLMLPDEFYEKYKLLDQILIGYLLPLFQVGFFLIGLNVFILTFDKDLISDNPYKRIEPNMNIELNRVNKSSEEIEESVDIKSTNDRKLPKKWKKTENLRLFGKFSLSIFIFERIISNIFALLFTLIFPTWNNSILNCIIFGIGMVLFWAFILLIIKKMNFKYSFEWFWSKLLKTLGKSPQSEIQSK